MKSRSSLMQNFDPLFRTQTPSPPERRRTKTDRYRIDRPFLNDEHNDSTGLIDDFAKCRIAETPKSEVRPYLQSYEPKPEIHAFVPQICEPKPDVLASAVQQQKENDLKDRISELEKESKQNDLKLTEITEQLDKSKESEQKNSLK